MTNAFGLVLDSASLRWAAAEGVPEAVIAAVLLLHERSVDDIVAKLTPGELEQVIKLVSRCPSYYPPGTLDTLKSRRQALPPKPHVFRPMWHPVGPLHGSSPALRTCAGPTSAGSQGSASMLLRALLSGPSVCMLLGALLSLSAP
jgi:hypothetical protein